MNKRVVKKVANRPIRKERGAVQTLREQSTVKSVVAVIMGSDSDWATMKDACQALDHFSVPYHVEIISAHRTPERVGDFAMKAKDQGFKVIIAGAGGAAHLPGMLAAHSTLPVIGVPIPNGALNGLDALYSIVQMPRGVPVMTMAIGGAWNAGLAAVQILSIGNGIESQRVAEEMLQYRESMKLAVSEKNKNFKRGDKK